MSVNTVAYGAVAVVALALFAIGTPAERSRQAALNLPPASVAVVAAAPVVTAAGIALRSVSFNLPVADSVYPGGAVADVMNANCASCHSAGMVMTQPSLTRATWTEEVNKMRNTYKAPVAAEDVPAIVAYLADLRPTR